MSKKLVQILKRESILKYGNFTLRSGKQSPYYCDIKEAFGKPQVLHLIVAELLKITPREATCIAGSGYGGITLATLLAYKKGLPLILVRDKVKDHGTRKSIDAYIPNENDMVCIVDDVYTTGSSVRDTQKQLRKTGARFTSPLVVFNRSKKIKILSIVNEADLRK